MIQIAQVSAVLVPFEVDGEKLIKRDDLPRFTETADVLQYIMLHPEISRRKDDYGRWTYVRIDWMEHSEPDLIKEYIDGVGTKAFGRKDWRKPK